MWDSWSIYWTFHTSWGCNTNCAYVQSAFARVQHPFLVLTANSKKFVWVLVCDQCGTKTQSGIKSYLWMHLVKFVQYLACRVEPESTSSVHSSVMCRVGAWSDAISVGKSNQLRVGINWIVFTDFMQIPRIQPKLKDIQEDFPDLFNKAYFWNLIDLAMTGRGNSKIGTHEVN